MEVISHGLDEREKHNEFISSRNICPMPITSSIVNAADIRALLSSDPIFKKIHSAYGAPPDWQRPPGFVSLCRIILEQQVSLASARAHFDKLSAFVPSMTPEHLLSLTDEEMRHCQISRQKSRYLKALANAVVEGHLDLESLPDQPEDLIRAHLTRVPGIGGWTCDIYLMFCLQKKDILPLGDVAILSAVTSVTGLTSKEAISERSQLWKPLRTLASFYLWHAYLRSRNRPVIL